MKLSSFLSRLSFRTKLTATSVGMVILALGAVITTSILQFNSTTEHATQTLRKMSIGELENIALSMASLADWQVEELTTRTKRLLDRNQLVLKDLGGIDADSTQKVQWEATDQFSHKKTEVSLPQMQIGDTKILPCVDTVNPMLARLQSMVSGQVTIFQKMNDRGDMLRIATTVKTKEGKIAVGTYIPAVMEDGKPNPVVGAILKGEKYYGKAWVVDQWCIAGYAPLYDLQHNLVGMIYSGLSMQESVKAFCDIAGKLKIGDTGYIYILSTAEKTKGQYILSYQNKRDGEIIWDAKDADGRFFIREIVEGAVKLGKGQTGICKYPWQNKGETAPRMKSATYTYIPEWEMAICPSAYDDEVYKTAIEMNKEVNSAFWWQVWAGIFFTVLASGAFAWIARKASLQIRTSVVAFSESAQNVSASSSQISSASEAIAQGATVQASAVAEITASMQGIATQSRESVSIANSASASVQEASSLSRTCFGCVEEMSHAVEAIHGSVTEVSRHCIQEAKIAENADAAVSRMRDFLGKLGDSAREVGSIVDVIGHIADQTNLLALNATIEAASAGEAGRGFAVVAGEVKQLAHESAKSAEKIAEQIRTMQANSEHSLNEIENVGQTTAEMNQIAHQIASAVSNQSSGGSRSDVAAQTDRLLDLASKAARYLGDMNRSSDEMKHSVEKIVAGADVQTRATEEMALAIEEISVRVHANAATSEETAASSMVLREEARGILSRSQEMLRFLDGDKSSDQISKFEP